MCRLVNQKGERHRLGTRDDVIEGYCDCEGNTREINAESPERKGKRGAPELAGDQTLRYENVRDRLHRNNRRFRPCLMPIAQESDTVAGYDSRIYFNFEHANLRAIQ